MECRLHRLKSHVLPRRAGFSSGDAKQAIMDLIRRVMHVSTSMERQSVPCRSPLPRLAKPKPSTNSYPLAEHRKAASAQDGTVLVKRRRRLCWTWESPPALDFFLCFAVCTEYAPLLRRADWGVGCASIFNTAAMARLSWRSLIVPLLATTAASLGWDGSQEPLTDKANKFDKAACPDYAYYATFPQ